jgi:hypothetical protein
MPCDSPYLFHYFFDKKSKKNNINYEIEKPTPNWGGHSPDAMRNSVVPKR